MTIIETRGLGKDFGDVAAVAAVDLDVAEGEIFGLLGPNGAGKTTAISMICGVITPSRGTARIAGHDIARARFEARRALGLVPQDLALYEAITARQNLAFFGSLYGLSRAALAERIAWALEVAGLSDRADEPVTRYSGGMKRRLNLAAGLLHRPRVLVLDEPTVGVDPQSRNHIFETVRALQRDHRMTVLYTSHYMEEVESLCDRVAIMDRGQVIAQGRIKDMIADHGGGSLQIEIDADANAAAGAMEAVRQALGAAAVAGEARPDADADGAGAGAQLSLDSGDDDRRHTVRIVPGGGPAGAGTLGAALSAVERAPGVRVLSVHTLGADLETVFLDLTGKRLRDD